MACVGLGPSWVWPRLVAAALVNTACASRRPCRDTSQYGQTTKFLEMHRGLVGTFIEFGCANGIENSNTHMLECLGWHGVCIEPVDTITSRAHGLRGAVCEPGRESVAIVVANKDGLHGVRPNLNPFGALATKVKTVKCHDLGVIREQHGMNNVTYMTVDTEGNESDLLEAYMPLDWVTWLQVECNTVRECVRVRGVLMHSFKIVHFFPFDNGRGGGDILFRRRFD